MELGPDSWVIETQTTLKGLNTAVLKGQHSRIRRAKARENWYNTGVSDDGHLVKPFKFIDQQELKYQKNSKLLSSIRSHVKQDTYMKRQASIASRQDKKKTSVHPNILPKVDPSRNLPTQFTAKHLVLPNEETAWENIRRLDFWQLHSSKPSGIWLNDPFNTFGGFAPFDCPRETFLLSHCKDCSHLLRRSHLTSLTDRDMAIQAWFPEAVESVIEWTRSNIILLHVVLYVSLPPCQLHT